jgi:hypothetical protein
MNIEQRILNHEIITPSKFDILNSTCPLMPFGDKFSIRCVLYYSNN